LGVPKSKSHFLTAWKKINSWLLLFLFKKKPSGSERWRKTLASTDTMRFLRATESEVILQATKWLLSFCDLTVSAIQFQKHTHTQNRGWWEPVKELCVNRWNGAAFRIQLCRVFLVCDDDEPNVLATTIRWTVCFFFKKRRFWSVLAY
jgi:hypothetical protein